VAQLVFSLEKSSSSYIFSEIHSIIHSIIQTEPLFIIIQPESLSPAL